jgi:hypothetical protein
MASLKVEALKARYEAQRKEALATLEVYYQNSVGIGEHHQIIDEMDALVRKVSEANDLIATLETLFIAKTENTTNTTKEQE